MNPVKSIRLRYVLGLGALAFAILVTYFLVQDTIERQENHGRLINIAGNQIGLSNRIAFFISQMGTSTSLEDYNVSRQQVGRAINLMRAQHQLLLHGEPTRDVPHVMTPLLKITYFDPNLGLDTAIKRFLKYAEIVYHTEFGKLFLNSASYAYVVTYGPFVLEPLLNAAVTEYENYSRHEIQKLQHLELLMMIVTISLLAFEAVFIFRPLEKKVSVVFQELRSKGDELTHEKNRAENANRLKTDLLSNMSHELRTPLNAIVGFAECLKIGVYGPLASASQTESVDCIYNSGVHLLDLVNDILDISAAEAGAIELVESVISIDELILSSVKFLGPLPDRSGVTLHFSEEGGTFSLNADERRLRQVLINLLMNAVKFTPQNGNVRISKVRSADGRAGFAISDTGIGMTAQEIDIARDRFGQAGDVMTRHHDGTGLGLPLVIKLVACHDGVVSIQSEKGAGTTVTVLLPKNRVIANEPVHTVTARFPKITGLAGTRPRPPAAVA